MVIGRGSRDSISRLFRLALKNSAGRDWGHCCPSQGQFHSRRKPWAELPYPYRFSLEGLEVKLPKGRDGSFNFSCSQPPVLPHLGLYREADPFSLSPTDSKQN